MIPLNKKWMLSIRCMTYNHSSYIKNAMDGFVKQNTNFPYVAVIVDDASTDGEQDIIRKYIYENFEFPFNEDACHWETEDAYFYFTKHKKNHNCFFAVVLLKYNFNRIQKDKNSIITEWINNSKYLAFCEGDDYWTSSIKLQKQVDLLEKNKEIGLVITECDIYYEKNKNYQKNIFYNGLSMIDKENPICSFGYLGNCSWVYRLSVIKESPNPKKFIDGALCLFYYLSLNSKIEFLDLNTAVYRRHEGSASCFSMDDLKRKYRYERDSFLIRENYAHKFQNKEYLLQIVYTEGLWGNYINALKNNDNEIINVFRNYFKDKLDMDIMDRFLLKYIDNKTEIQKIKSSFPIRIVSFLKRKISHIFIF